MLYATLKPFHELFANNLSPAARQHMSGILLQRFRNVDHAKCNKTLFNFIAQCFESVSVIDKEYGPYLYNFVKKVGWDKFRFAFGIFFDVINMKDHKKGIL